MPSVIERNGTYYTDDEVANLLGISLGRLRNAEAAILSGGGRFVYLTTEGKKAPVLKLTFPQEEADE